jgi:hypothetical protein
MRRIRAKEIETEEEAAFSDAAEQEVTFLLFPMRTYRLCSERAKKEGCTAAQVFERALLQYLREDKDGTDGSSTKIETSDEPSRSEPDLVFTRRRR